MQRVIRRTILAEKQAHRRLAKKKAKAEFDWLKTNRENTRYAQKQLTDRIKNAKLERREDWELGPLAPRRDVGDKQDQYGTTDQNLARGPVLSFQEKEKALERVGGKMLHFREGDRVVLIEGRDKGKIGKITKIDLSRAECSVEGLNMIEIVMPSYMLHKDDPDKSLVRAIEKPVPLTSIRLVYPLVDGKDVIIKKIVCGSFYADKHLGIKTWKRYVLGIDGRRGIQIPWPPPKPKKEHSSEGSTSERQVLKKTFVPTLTRPPMPTSVIDELRNKFSKFRTRHDPEYIAAKMEEDRLAEVKKRSISTMRTPLKDANRQERAAKKALGKGKLTPEMMMRIGQIIAQKRDPALNAMGVSSVGATPISA